ncbi:aldolase/citrate lyase family protein [Roseisolibacter sp. H3M3-2]|uniref:aldolase/citrate lyase family protein n=1 Tax=Roseisolibacter sp. H3M3-2 TaxID=3031323 RepID=UPI0023DB3A3B|nr:aldolase/citrate lyase family protein [Roseisolibacter sp. H3M3-2]MDF1501354.1 aldolase/citrate lyase family protein [Roseisolibacter sp. H3M3-2]
MRAPILLALATATAQGAFAQAPRHLNPMIDLHAAGKPVLGLYAPANPRPRPPQAAAAGAAPVQPAASTPMPAQKSQAELAADALAYTKADFIFDGSMEHDFDRGYAGFVQFMQAIASSGAVTKGSLAQLHHPLAVKMAKVGSDAALARTRIGKQLDQGVSTIVLVDVEDPAEITTAISAMRFAAKGGTRAESVGGAPAVWGMDDKTYRAKADVWPLNPQGELTAWAIVESKEGLARVREIAKTPGVAVLFPGAGTLRGVFSTVDPATQQRKFDTEAWENAIQQVLAACKEAKVPCGYPANDPATVEQRMKQGFSVFIAGWGEPGFKAVEYGRQASGR